MCYSSGTHHRAPTHACCLIIGWLFAAVRHLTDPGSESSSAAANTLMEHLQWKEIFIGHGATWTQHRWRIVRPATGSGAWACVGLQTYHHQCLWRLLLVAVVKANIRFTSLPLCDIRVHWKLWQRPCYASRPMNIKYIGVQFCQPCDAVTKLYRLGPVDLKRNGQVGWGCDLSKGAQVGGHDCKMVSSLST